MIDRRAQIERNNKILLEKMSHIMKMEAKDPDIHGDRDYAHSLNAVSRKKKLQKINQENIAMFHRLEAKKAHYNHEQWEKERKQSITYLRNISAYPANYLLKKKGVLPPIHPEAKVDK